MVFLTRLSGGRRIFVTYQWGKPQPGTQLSKNSIKSIVIHQMTQASLECRECLRGQCPPQISH